MRRTLLSFLGALCVGCGSGGSTGTVPPGPTLDPALVGHYALWDFFYNYTDGTQGNATDFDVVDGSIDFYADGTFSQWIYLDFQGIIDSGTQTGRWYVTQTPSGTVVPGIIVTSAMDGSCAAAEYYLPISGDPFVDLIFYAYGPGPCYTGNPYEYAEQQYERRP